MKNVTKDRIRMPHLPAWGCNNRKLLRKPAFSSMIREEFSKPQEGDIMRKSILLLAAFLCTLPLLLRPAQNRTQCRTAVLPSVRRTRVRTTSRKSPTLLKAMTDRASLRRTTQLGMNPAAIWMIQTARTARPRRMKRETARRLITGRTVCRWRTFRRLRSLPCRLY